MNGARRILFAGLAAGLRAIAWIPLGIGKAVSACADWCEERAHG